MSDEFIGEAGGIPGLVRIIANSKGQPIRVEIDDLIFKKEDKQLISDVFVAALNNLQDKIMKASTEKLLELYEKQGKKSPLADLLMGKLPEIK